MPETKQQRAYHITNHTQQKGSKDNLIVIRSQKGEEIAYNVLGDKALRIYLMLTANANGFTCLMSSNQIGGKPLPQGMSRSSFTRAIRELKDNGFLVKREDEDKWDFYDTPKDAEEMLVEIHKSEIEKYIYEDLSQI